MEITPKQLLAVCGALFAGIVAINFAEQYRSNAQFKEKLSGLDLSGMRSRLLREEGVSNELPEMEQPIEVPLWQDLKDEKPEAETE